MDKKSLTDNFKQMQVAYQNLFLGSLELLELNTLFWTEKALLRLVNVVSRKRLVSLKGILANAEVEGDKDLLQENMMEVQIAALLGGHKLGNWTEANDVGGYQAVCSICGKSVFVSGKALYSHLADTCPSQVNNRQANS